MALVAKLPRHSTGIGSKSEALALGLAAAGCNLSAIVCGLNQTKTAFILWKAAIRDIRIGKRLRAMRASWFNWGDFCQKMLAIRDSSEHASVFEIVACPRAFHSEAERLIGYLGIEDNVELIVSERRPSASKSSPPEQLLRA